MTTDWVLGQLVKDRLKAQRRYTSFVFDGLGEKYRKDFHQGVSDKCMLSDDRFLAQISRAAVDAQVSRATLDDIVALVCQK